MRTAHRNTCEDAVLPSGGSARRRGELPLALSLAMAAVTAALVALVLLVSLAPHPVEDELPVSFCLPRRGVAGQPACTCSAGPVEAPGVAGDYRRVLDSWQAAGLLTARDLDRMERQMLLACGFPPRGDPAGAGPRSEPGAQSPEKSSVER